MNLEKRKKIILLWKYMNYVWGDLDVGGETRDYFISENVTERGIARLSIKHGAEIIRTICDDILNEIDDKDL